ncbi:MAG: hypothetical protein NTV22_00365, partial [bacterium]|nr:hypothetical protein [bacterium]
MTGLYLENVISSLAQMKPGMFPQGWDEGRVHEVLAQCEAHTEDEAVAEDEAAFENQSQSLMEIPNARVPNVRALMAAQHDEEMNTNVPIKRGMHSPLRAQRISCITPRNVVRMAFLMLAVAASPVPVFGLNITVTNLTPPTADAGSANAVNGTWQGGSITIAAVNYPALWSGSAASYIDLTPAGATGGNVYAVSGSELGGTAIVGGHTHAALWSGSTHTYTDLHP